VISMIIRLRKYKNVFVDGDKEIIFTKMDFNWEGIWITQFGNLIDIIGFIDLKDFFFTVIGRFRRPNVESDGIVFKIRSAINGLIIEFR